MSRIKSSSCRGSSVAIAVEFICKLKLAVLTIFVLSTFVSGVGQQRQYGSQPNFSNDLLKRGSKQELRNDAIQADAAALPTYRIVDIISQNPEVLLQAKQMALRFRWDDEARTEQPRKSTSNLTDNLSTADDAVLQSDQIHDADANIEQQMSDDELFDEIDQHIGLRVALTHQLESKGLLTSADYERLSAKRNSQIGRQPRTADREEIVDQNQPEVSHSWSPYENLPALRDLYAQFPLQQQPLIRFGSDVFRRGSGNVDDLPMDLPVGPDYVLGPGDGVTLNVWGGISRKISAVVDRSGRISLPETGAVVVAGKNIVEAQSTIEQALNTQFHDVKVDLSLARLRTVRVYVVGDVERPGAYDVSSLSTPLNALYAAGGPTARGSLRRVRHYRGKQLIEEIDLYDFLLNGIRSDGERIQPGDTILIPPTGPQVSVAGMVRRPAIYELKSETELGQVLNLAGGVLVSATLRQINVERIEAHQYRTMVSLKLPEDDNHQPLAKSLSSFTVQDGDRIAISPILPYSEQTIYLQGHAYRPGKYPFHKGMTVSDVLSSYQDLLPEPADRAEIVRLSPPNYRPTVIDFKLSEVLSGDDPIELQPFDTIRIFGRYEVDAPKVAIYGEVLRPGEYPLSQGMTVTGLLRMAGGFKRSAMTQRAEVASYVVQNGEKVLVKHTIIALSKAMDGDSTADTVLKPGDVVTIHPLVGWNDIGASITVKGELMYPGTYGIQAGEKLSAVLERAGGFRKGAYPAGAILERVQVREIEEKNRQQLIARIQSTSANFKAGSATGQEQLAMMQAMQQQQQQVLAALRSQPVPGRLVINISADISKWKNTTADIELRDGDVLFVPKYPNLVVVSGQVYNSSAITYTPGKSAEWYLKQAGGPTELANKKGIFLIRANGSVVGGGSSRGWWGGGVLSTRLQPGDSIVVPDKIIGGSMVWKNLMTTAQLMSSVALTAGVASTF
jgi:protein involved in polysaccharide export with SLBB domain